MTDGDDARDVEALERGLGGTPSLTLRRPLAAPKPLAVEPPFAVQPCDGGFAPDVDTRRLNQLLDQLDADERLARGGR